MSNLCIYRYGHLEDRIWQHVYGLLDLLSTVLIQRAVMNLSKEQKKSRLWRCSIINKVSSKQSRRTQGSQMV
ncbi:hypothetical protein BDA96_09G146600 [Sorghum bicolor]|uniref:Uncharacterized protein n=2 Tax=Sorghum bicolor TaxID=4558 RepID=A0A921QD26_SORBI|nr:hypothetical protein BDA96_09G146600 [Sorghum bicolor]KXG22014.1 hypothetical protein SORBI_3009G139100 [Sorghum bicolor]